MPEIQKDYMAKIAWSRPTYGAPHAFFGSEVKTDHSITVSISRASVYAEDGRTFNLGKHVVADAKPLIEIEMTPIQWAEFLSSGNYDGGVPCTICKFDGKFASPVEVPNVAEEFKADVRAAFGQLNQKMASFETLINNTLAEGKTLNKTQLRELANHMKWARQNSQSDINFVRDQFIEQMASVVMKAKAEVCAFAERHLGSAKVLCDLGSQEVFSEGAKAESIE